MSRICYADPPYPGMAEKHYAHDPRCAEVDHVELIGQLLRDFPDGWALSTSSVALEYVIKSCRANGLNQKAGDYRIGAWVKPFASFKPNVTRAYTWEPVIFRGGREPTRDEPTVRDHVACGITLQRGLVGAKPMEFCFWIFDLLGLKPGDEFVDLYPGSGAVTRAYERWQQLQVPQSADGSLFKTAAPVRPSPAVRTAGGTP